MHDRAAFANLDHARVISTAEGNPLVMQWIVGQIDLAQDPQEVLDDLAHGEGEAAQRVFDRSFNLPQLEKGGRAALLALSLFVPSATRTALSEVAGMGNKKDKQRFRDSIKALSALWLIRATEDQRLTVEGLTREFARARITKDPRSKTFSQRFISRFLQYAKNYKQPTPSNFNALEMEKDNLMAAMDMGFDSRDWISVVNLISAINYDGANDFLTVRGYWDEAIRRGEQGLEAARQLRIEKLVASLAHSVALTSQARGDLAKAQRLYDESLEIVKSLGDEQGIAASLHQLGSLARDQGDYALARRLFGESLEISRKLGESNYTSRILRALGMVAQEQGNYGEARRLFGESLEIEKSLGYQQGIAASMHQLGAISLEEEYYEVADSLFSHSLATLRKLGDRLNVAECLESIGKLRIAQGRYSEAAALLDESFKQAEALRAMPRVGSVKHSLGLLAEKQGDVVEAERLFREALEIFEGMGSGKVGMARESLERVKGGVVVK